MTRIIWKGECELDSNWAQLLLILPSLQNTPLNTLHKDSALALRHSSGIKGWSGSEGIPLSRFVEATEEKGKKNCLPCKYNEVTLRLMSPNCRGTVTPYKQVQTGLSFHTLMLLTTAKKACAKNFIQVTDLPAKQKAIRGRTSVAY